MRTLLAVVVLTSTASFALNWKECQLEVASCDKLAADKAKPDSPTHKRLCEAIRKQCAALGKTVSTAPTTTKGM